MTRRLRLSCLAILGLGAVVTTHPGVRAVLVVLGACAMLWMAWQLARSGEMASADRSLASSGPANVGCGSSLVPAGSATAWR